MLIKLLKALNDRLGFPRPFGWQLRFELRLLFVRLGNRFSPAYKRKVAALRREKGLRVVFGCGDETRSGWVNVDALPAPGVGIACDLRKPLPFAAESARLVYSEHFLEHLEYEEAISFLRECNRLMGPRARIRIVVPDMERFVRAYLDGDEAFFQTASPHETHPVRSLNLLFRWYGSHKFAYDYQTLKELLEEAGFHDVERFGCNESRIDELHVDIDTPQRRAESMYVEAVK
jgi:predicted SAM-dependent methyltransferase